MKIMLEQLSHCYHFVSNMVFQATDMMNVLITVKSTVLEGVEDYVICAFTSSTYSWGHGGWPDSLGEMGFTASSGDFAAPSSPIRMKSYCKTVSVHDTSSPSSISSDVGTSTN